MAKKLMEGVPQFAEHTDEIVRWLGHDEEELMRLKIEGAIT